MPPASFTDLYGQVGRLRDAGDAAGAIALLRENLKTFPLHRGVVHQVLAENLAREGNPKEAIDALQEAVAAGCRYKAAWLTGDPLLAPLLTEPRFVKLVRKTDERYTVEAAVARPDLLVRGPSGEAPASGRPLLVALHGNNSNARETARFWSSATAAGWVVAVPQSSEIASSPDSYTWNDRSRILTQVETHVARAKELHKIDESRVVIGGFSMGGLQAIALPLALGFQARGILPVAAWLPDVKEFAPLVTNSATRDLRAYIVVGQDDPSADGALKLAALLQKNGAKTKLDTRAGLDHEYPADMEATLARALNFLVS